MISVDYKSSGTLLGELITASLKIKNIGEKSEFVQRYNDITSVLESRGILSNGIIQNSEIDSEFENLKLILEDLWWAVEEVIKLRKTNQDDIEVIRKSGYAALDAFELNAKRCNIIRDIDNKLGEGSVTFLEKSY